MTKADFYQFIQSAKPLIRFHGQTIAKNSGVDYNTYCQYLKGICPDEEKRISIHAACIELIEENKKLADAVLPA